MLGCLRLDHCVSGWTHVGLGTDNLALFLPPFRHESCLSKRYAEKSVDGGGWMWYYPPSAWHGSCYGKERAESQAPSAALAGARGCIDGMAIAIAGIVPKGAVLAGIVTLGRGVSGRLDGARRGAGRGSCWHDPCCSIDRANQAGGRDDPHSLARF